MNETDIQNMADTVNTWLQEAPERDKMLFVKSTKKELIVYHNTLGRKIRNYFELWKNEYTPIIENGIDISENHPDQISMKVIEKVWEMNKNE
jgi:hypothetical protein